MSAKRIFSRQRRRAVMRVPASSSNVALAREPRRGGRPDCLLTRPYPTLPYPPYGLLPLASY